jgi:hypothetical protein
MDCAPTIPSLFTQANPPLAPGSIANIFFMFYP